MEDKEESTPPVLSSLTIKIKDHQSSSTANSPSLVSPPSSAFVSALQSPYISPRATTPPPPPSSSSSSDIPSTSYTPPSDPYEFSDSAAARISFSFPRISKLDAPPPSAPPKLRSCDVFIGYHGNAPNLLRFCRWLKSDLELQGIACFLADRAKYADSQSHDIADRLICSVAYGVVVASRSSLVNRLSLDEITFFSHKKNLLPILFDLDVDHHVADKDALACLLRCHSDFNLQTDPTNWRQCVARAAAILRAKLGRKSITTGSKWQEELPFPRNEAFVGREEEIAEMEATFFGGRRRRHYKGGQSQSEEEEESGAGHKKSSSSVFCIHGVAGMGKTELALEFGHRYAQRYSMVLWVGGECRFLKQNILKLSAAVGVDVSADPQKERGRIRSFEEQESEAVKRVRREVFRDIPYLLIVDNLQDPKDLSDFLPKTIGASHVIITSRSPPAALAPLCCRSMQVGPLVSSDAWSLLTKKEYSTAEAEFLRKFQAELGGVTLGLRLVGCLLSELGVAPSWLFQQVLLEQEDEEDDHEEEVLKKPNHNQSPFLIKVLSLSFRAVRESNGLAGRMAAVAAWAAPTPVSARVLGESWRRRKWRCRRKEEAAAAMVLVRMGLGRKGADGSKLQLHPLAQELGRRGKIGREGARALVLRNTGKSEEEEDDDLLEWATAYMVFGYKREAAAVEMKAEEIVEYVRKRAVGVGVRAFTRFSRCSSGAELLKVCTNALEEVEKSFVANHGGEDSDSDKPPCWWWRWWGGGSGGGRRKRTEEGVWREVTLVKAAVLETRAKLLMRGGYFDSAEELCRTCISIRTVMLGHSHTLTLAAQDTLANLVRIRTKIHHHHPL